MENTIQQLEIALKPGLFDAEGENLRIKAKDYFGIVIDKVCSIRIITIDHPLNPKQSEIIRTEIFTNPVTQISAYQPLDLPFSWTIWIGYRPGVRDNPGSTAVEAVEDILGVKFKNNEGIYTSRRYCLQGNLERSEVEIMATELLSNDIIQQWQCLSSSQWDPVKGIGKNIPKVILNHRPIVCNFPVQSDQLLEEISAQRNLALHPQDIPQIRKYFLNPEVRAHRALVGLFDPTDIELEYISQARSDHCNHNTFQGCFYYQEAGKVEKINNLFKTYIQGPTLELKARKPWVISVLWDNAGVAVLDHEHYYTITGETHNSPSNMEAYGGSITGIVGVYRDPLGTGLGSRLVMGSYGFCVGPRDYNGHLKPRLHPRRLLDGVIEGVRDGGNKSGIPTTFGQVFFEHGYLGKCLVFVTAVGIMPAQIHNRPSEQKTTAPGELIVMCGGRVGKDGIHGVTASSESFSAHTPAGHVQIGDPYTQKKMHDFLLQARDQNLFTFITDNGGGGLSSSIGESALLSNGCEVDLEKVPLKYEGLDQWEIWVSESQERMTIAVKPENLKTFLHLSQHHGVESTVIGCYTNSGKLHIRYHGKTCAYIDLDFLESGFPQWEFTAEWQAPENRGLQEPVFKEPQDYNTLLTDMLSRPNLASKEWITRQYDHEVQGSSIIKPLVGICRDVNSDAAVIRPVLTSNKGLAFAQALLPTYSRIDAYQMTACVIDEAVRRLVAVGADPEQIGGVDNFCWPGIQYDQIENPDGKFKAAQLVRACKALRDMCLAYGIPLLSGKDSMYVDGHLAGKYGETHKVSGLETLQFSATSIVHDISKCVTMEAKFPGDLVYVVGVTREELGGSEYYEILGYTGLSVPCVHPEESFPLYQALANAIQAEVITSLHGIYRGGLAVHLALTAMGGEVGIDFDLKHLSTINRSDTLLFSESPGRFIVTVEPARQQAFEALLKNQTYSLCGKVITDPVLKIRNLQSETIINIDITFLKKAWKKTFGDLI